MRRKMRILCIGAALIMMLTACGSSMEMATDSMEKADMMVSGDYNYGYNYEYGYDAGMSDNMAEEWVTDEVWVETEKEYGSAGLTASGSNSSMGNSGSNEMLTGDKLVYTCDLTLQTLDYDACVEAIKNNINTYKGIIESETENDNAHRWYYEDYVKTGGTRYLYLTIRIPSEKYYEFLETLEGNGKIISKSSYVENISRQYYETGAMIESLEIQQDRLLEMMAQAYSIEDMITIEARLSEVQYQLSLYKNRLSSMDADVEYSTITIRVEEVMEYVQEEPVVKTNTFGDRLWNTLVETWESFLEMLEFLLFFAIRMIPVAVILGVVVLITLFIIRCSKKKKARKMQNMQSFPDMQNTQDKQ